MRKVKSYRVLVWMVMLFMIAQAIIISKAPSHKVGILDCIPRGLQR
ncbi:MAG: hypothetical protein GTO00_09230 [Deltaproteobacteria bacterium]|nr:hypothetical protein [Deltaproteobacteria bacterium]